MKKRKFVKALVGLFASLSMMAGCDNVKDHHYGYTRVHVIPAQRCYTIHHIEWDNGGLYIQAANTSGGLGKISFIGWVPKESVMLIGLGCECPICKTRSAPSD